MQHTVAWNPQRFLVLCFTQWFICVRPLSQAPNRHSRPHTHTPVLLQTLAVLHALVSRPSPCSSPHCLKLIDRSLARQVFQISALLVSARMFSEGFSTLSRARSLSLAASKNQYYFEDYRKGTLLLEAPAD